MVKLLLPGENPELAKKALEKCLSHFKTLTYSSQQDVPLIQNQINLHESLVNGTGKLTFGVSTIRPIDDKPCLRFGVEIGGKTEFFQPWLSDQGSDGVSVLWEILTDEELYALGLDGVQKNIAWWEKDLKEKTENGTTEEDYNGHYTKGSLAKMQINLSENDLEIIQHATKERIRTVMKIGN